MSIIEASVARSGSHLCSSQILFFVVSSSLLISLTSSMILMLSFILYGASVDPTLLFAAFALTFSVYNLDRVLGHTEDLINDPGRSNFLFKKRGWLMSAAIASLSASLLIGAWKGVKVLLVLIMPIIVGFLYSKGLLSLPRLKSIPGVKNLVIVTVWASVPTILPTLVAESPVGRFYSHASATIFYFILVKALINTILFDMRDVGGDGAAGVKTVPIILGETNTRRLLLLLNSTLVAWSVLCWLAGFFLPYLPVIFADIVYGFWYILRFTKRPGEGRLLLDLMVDGEWIPLTLLLFTIQAFR